LTERAKLMDEAFEETLRACPITGS
jgi:hypothetical protein